MIAAPSDAAPFDAGAYRKAIEEGLRPAVAGIRLAVEFLSEPTENLLRKRLSQGEVHVFHFIGHGRSQQAAQYGTVVFQDSTGKSRSVSAPYLATILKSHPTLRAAFLQACDDGDDPLGQVAEALATQGLAATVSGGRVDAQVVGLFASQFYSMLFSGASVDAAFSGAKEALVTRGHSSDRARFRLRGHDTAAPLFEIATVPAATVDAGSADHPPATNVQTPTAVAIQAAARVAQAEAYARQVQQKQAAGAFDVFLCHNWADKSAVKKIALQLKARGILPWLDEWELPPGQPWQQLLERQIGSISSAAVFVGGAGVGPWQEQELYGFLREFVSRHSPVIPVLLTDAPDQPELPIFLRAMTWVDFRLSDPDPLDRLIWGITGTRASAE